VKFSALIAIVHDKDEEEAIKVAKEAGAGGVTILHGKNIGLEEKKVFFGLTLEENVSALLFVLPQKLSVKVMKELKSSFDFDSDDYQGFMMTMPLSHVAGLDNKELHQFEDSIRDML
jgi:hypothetical protein